MQINMHHGHEAPHHTHCGVQLIINNDHAMMKFTGLDEHALFRLFLQTLYYTLCLSHDRSAINP